MTSLPFTREGSQVRSLHRPPSQRVDLELENDLVGIPGNIAIPAQIREHEQNTAREPVRNPCAAFASRSAAWEDGRPSCAGLGIVDPGDGEPIECPECEGRG